MESNIKKVNEAFKLFVENHALLNEYKGIDYLGASENTTYPILWAAWAEARISVKQGSLNPVLPIYILMPRKGYDWTTVLAQTTQIAYDFLITYAENERQYGFRCDINTDITPTGTSGADGAIGVMFNISIMFRASRNENAIPFE